MNSAKWRGVRGAATFLAEPSWLPLRKPIFPWPWRRNLWVITAYWALDFCGPIIGGVDFSL